MLLLLLLLLFVVVVVIIVIIMYMHRNAIMSYNSFPVLLLWCRGINVFGWGEKSEDVVRNPKERLLRQLE